MTEKDDRTRTEVANGLYVIESNVLSTRHFDLKVAPGLVLTVLSGDPAGPRDHRFDRDPTSPFRHMGDVRFLLTQSVRRFQNDSGRPVPDPAWYLYFKGGNGHTYMSGFGGKKFRASGATRQAALRRLTEKMLAAWPNFASVALWSHNPEVR